MSERRKLKFLPSRKLAGRLAPAIVLVCALGWTFGELWEAGAGRSVVAPSRNLEQAYVMAMADITFETWLVARNARTLLTNPGSLIDTEHCAPYENTMIYGVPMVTMGVLGIPAVLLGIGPIGIYNVSILLMLSLAAVAMYLLIVDWTGSRGAAIVAALLFAFHPIRINNLQHPSVWDMTWTAFALLFARRLFAYGRWRDASGLAVACVLQICASFYALLAATFVSPPFIIWLFVTYGRQKIRISHVAAVALPAAATVVVLLLPYAEARDTGEITMRTWHRFATWPGYLTGTRYAIGWLVLVLAAVGLAPGRKPWREGLSGDPRWALLAGALLVAFVAAGPNTFWSPDPYLLLSRIVPGMDSVRVITRLGAGVHLVACVLAGVGSALLIRRSGRVGPMVGVGLMMLVVLDLYRPEFLGLAPRNDLTAVEIQPPDRRIEFARALGELEVTGPVFEVPFEASQLARIDIAVDRIFDSFYHGRRTSACYGSYVPADIDELTSIAAGLPDAEALARLRERGFTTIVAHKPARKIAARRQAIRFARADSRLRLVATGEHAKAYDILDFEVEGSSSAELLRSEPQ